jgi:hypothetical protein
VSLQQDVEEGLDLDTARRLDRFDLTLRIEGLAAGRESNHPTYL